MGGLSLSARGKVDETVKAKEREKETGKTKNTKMPGPSGEKNAGGKRDEPKEMTRREREAVEKERARQHYLMMKEKEDAARLAVIRRRREEEALLHAAEQKGILSCFSSITLQQRRRPGSRDDKNTAN